MEKITIENINTPGKKKNVDKEKYHAMKKSLLKVIGKGKKGKTQAEILEKVAQIADKRLWPNGEKTGWWATTVRLDLEAKGVVIRNNTTPLTWYCND